MNFLSCLLKMSNIDMEYIIIVVLVKFNYKCKNINNIFKKGSQKCY